VQKHNTSTFLCKDRQKLDRLIGAAMLDDMVHRRLIDDRDTVLFEEFGLSPVTQAWLCTVQAPSLTTLAYAITLREQDFRL
jgi:hypothetical protein